MEPDPIGFALVAFGAIIACFGKGPAIAVAMGFLVLPSTALVTLSAVGGASVTVPQFGLVLLFVLAVTRREALPRLAAILARLPAAQVLALFAIYIVAGAVIMPRLFAGVTDVFTLARISEVIVTAPLIPSSGNITQPLYMVANIVAFFCVLVLVREPRDLEPFLRGFRTLLIVQTGLALIDAAGKYGGLGAVLSFLQTASYTMLTDVDIGGIPRITGQYSEASAFAMYSAGQIGFAYGMWRGGATGRIWPALCVTLVVLVAASTSSAGYVFLGVGGLWVAVTAIGEFARGRLRHSTVVMLGLLPIGVLAFLVLAIVNDAVLSGVSDFFDQMLFSKAGSESGRERSHWNSQAWLNFQETVGFGIGLGSARSSSWIMSLISQVGVFGSLLYAIFIGLVLAAPRHRDPNAPDLGALQLGGKLLCVAMIIAASISWTQVDLGLTFHIAAALAVRAGALRGESLQIWQLSTAGRTQHAGPS